MYMLLNNNDLVYTNNDLQEIGAPIIFIKT